MEPVTAINQLGERVQYFTGHTLADSLKAAEAFGKSRGVKMGRYYIQKTDGKSIIADYAS